MLTRVIFLMSYIISKVFASIFSLINSIIINFIDFGPKYVIKSRYMIIKQFITSTYNLILPEFKVPVRPLGCKCGEHVHYRRRKRGHGPRRTPVRIPEEGDFKRCRRKRLRRAAQNVRKLQEERHRSGWQPLHFLHKQRIQVRRNRESNSRSKQIWIWEVI